MTRSLFVARLRVMTLSIWRVLWNEHGKSYLDGKTMDFSKDLPNYSQVISLYKNTKISTSRNDKDKISAGKPFKSEDERYNGIYYGFPITAQTNVKKAHEYLFGTKDYKPTEELQKISAKIKVVTDYIGITE